MKLIDLLNVIDGDMSVNITVEYREVFDGVLNNHYYPQELKVKILEREVKSVWYSKIYERIMIEC